MFNIGSIGCGHMGMAILDVIAEPADILVYEIDTERRHAAKTAGFASAGSESEVYANSRILLLAVPPQACEQLLTKLALTAQRQARGPVIVNIMAGISSAYIRSHLGADTAVITVMPTLGMKSNQGMAALAHTDNVPKDILAQILKVFQDTGEAIIVEEPQLKEIVAVNGCMPGYVYYLIDAFAKAAQDHNVDYNTAVRMISRGFIGAATQVLDGGDPKDLLSHVCTSGGLTAQGVQSFDQSKLSDALAKGVSSSIKRGYELAK